MDSCCKISSPIISAFVFFLLFISFVCSVNFNNNNNNNTKQKLKDARAYLKKINKPAVKTIQSPDGDLIDCVLSHQQPAFDHPLLKGQKPMELPEMPEEHTSRADINYEEDFQVWRIYGESCPENTIPIRRTTEDDVLRATSVRTFGRKLTSPIRRDSNSNGHEHVVGHMEGSKYFGAKAIINVWAPRVANQHEFSLSQIWVVAGSFGFDLNTIEAGWQVDPEFYGDNQPRLFIYWTSDAYKNTGCYNLLCSGFVQTSTKIAIGEAIWPVSSYNGLQYDIPILVWRDPKHKNWWLQVHGFLVGYWPNKLFTHLGGPASMVQFGGEIVNTKSSGSHTSTQMGSGHFATEGFGKASYFRNLQLVDSGNNLINISYLPFLVDTPNCYNTKLGGWTSNVWGAYFFYGGPGGNMNCP